jgi:hypothetical protein
MGISDTLTPLFFILKKNNKKKGEEVWRKKKKIKQMLEQLEGGCQVSGCQVSPYSSLFSSTYSVLGGCQVGQKPDSGVSGLIVKTNPPPKGDTGDTLVIAFFGGCCHLFSSLLTMTYGQR